MKSVVIIAEQLSGQSLSAAIPANGIAVISINEGTGGVAVADDAQSYRAFRSTTRFTPRYRVELAVEDDAVEAVFDGIDVAYGAGLFSDAEVWAVAPALALSA